MRSCDLRVARACPERAGRFGRYNTYLLTYLTCCRKHSCRTPGWTRTTDPETLTRPFKRTALHYSTEREVLNVCAQVDTTGLMLYLTYCSVHCCRNTGAGAGLPVPVVSRTHQRSRSHTIVRPRRSGPSYRARLSLPVVAAARRHGSPPCYKRRYRRASSGRLRQRGRTPTANACCFEP